MKNIILAVGLLSGCTIASRHVQAQSTTYFGTIGSFSFTSPAGQKFTSTVLELSEPIDVPGISDSVTRIELILSEEYLVTLGEYKTGRVSIDCDLNVSGIWGYPHASCYPKSIANVP